MRMSIETDVFANYLIVPARLVEYGFTRDGKKLVYSVDMTRGNFRVVIEYAHDKISGTIIDKSIDAEYTNFRMENDIGYAADVRERYIDILTDIRDRCAINQHFASAAARHAAAFIYNEFGISPEFLWEKYPSFAIFRRTDNRKWFALIANIPLNKLNPRAKPGAMIDIINIKIDATSFGRHDCPIYSRQFRPRITLDLFLLLTNTQFVLYLFCQITQEGTHDTFY